MQSVLAQTYRPIEIVIVDDGSEDDTPAVAQSLADASPGIVTVVRQPHIYYTAAWNTGMRTIRGEFVQFLDSDDLLLPKKFEYQVQALIDNPECGVSYCYVHEHPIDQPRTGTPARHTSTTFARMFPQLLSGKIWPSPSPLYRRHVVDSAGPFLDVRVQPDWEWECRVAARNVQLHHCRQFLGETRGTHAREGRHKGGVPPGRSADYLLVLESIVDHARQGGVTPEQIDVLAPKLFAASRYCAIDGREDLADRALTLARQIASPRRRARLSAYARVAQAAGAGRAAGVYDRIIGSTVMKKASRAAQFPFRAARFGQRKTADARKYVRGRQILADYTSHYQKSRQAYPLAGASARLSDEGFDERVRVIARGDRGPHQLSDHVYRAIDRVARSAASALECSRQCRFVPALTSQHLPERTEAIHEVMRGEVITAQLLQPLALEGLVDLCEPLVGQIEQQIYGSHVLVDKVYVYRSFPSTQTARASWVWHFDNHPREMLKVMIYLTDVSADTAPFEYLRRADGRAVLGTPLAPRFGSSRIDDETYRQLRADGCEPVAVTGERGTVIVFDDNIVHRATIATGGTRDVLVLQIRPSLISMMPRVDPRWTGSFLHHDINPDPYDLVPRLKA